MKNGSTHGPAFQSCVFMLFLPIDEEIRCSQRLYLNCDKEESLCNPVWCVSCWGFRPRLTTRFSVWFLKSRLSFLSITTVVTVLSFRSRCSVLLVDTSDLKAADLTLSTLDRPQINGILAHGMM